MKDDQFESLDIAKISSMFDEYFQPSIKWDLYLYKENNKKVGIIYFYESKDKPIICTKNDSKAKFSEGFVFYRYGGQVKNIRFAELNKIIQSKIEKERTSWQRFLSQVIQIKPEKALIVDLDKGIINEGSQKIIIDESIVDKFKFIKEGEFNEKIGAPTLKLVGEISSIGKVIEKVIPTPYAITADRIFETFFNQSCDQPLEYVKTLCFETSPYFPLWFFVSESGKSVTEVEDTWISCKNARSDVRKKLIHRLSSDNEKSYEIGKILSLDCNFSMLEAGNIDKHVEKFKNDLGLSERSTPTVKRSIVYNAITSGYTGIVSDLIEKNPRPVFEAISHLPSNYVSENRDWLLESLKTIYSLNQNPSNKTDFRKAICSVDTKLYHPEINIIQR